MTSSTVGNAVPGTGHVNILRQKLTKDAYLDPAFARAELEHMWSRVWQIACREEEIPQTGDFVTYAIGRESIIVSRQRDGSLKAFHNVCQHRGRRLCDVASGNAPKFHCRFHGWRWSLDGRNEYVTHQAEWEACEHMSPQELRLQEVRIGSWAGWVFIALDPAAEPLENYLAPLPEIYGPFEMEAMRYRWYKSIIAPCNWKVAIEAFNEGYHVAATHPQNLAFIDDISDSVIHGKHSMYAYPRSRPFGAPAQLTGLDMPADLRPGIARYYAELENTLKAIYSERSVKAAERLLTEVDETAPLDEVFTRLMQFQREASEAAGAGWPPVTPEQMMRAGAVWHMFPNIVFLVSPDGALVYRARPMDDDPDRCIFDIWSLERYAPGAEPPLVREFYPNPLSGDPIANFGLILAQDVENMGAVQAGMYSSGFRGSRINPMQETCISNFHQVLRDYLSSGAVAHD